MRFSTISLKDLFGGPEKGRLCLRGVRDTLVCILYTVNCQLSTVNFHLPNTPRDVPWIVCTLSASQCLGKYYLKIYRSKNIIIFLARDLGQFHDIS